MKVLVGEGTMWTGSAAGSSDSRTRLRALAETETHSMLSGVPVSEHGRSIRPPLSADTQHQNHESVRGDPSPAEPPEETFPLTRRDLDLASGLQLDPGDLLSSSSDNCRGEDEEGSTCCFLT